MEKVGSVRVAEEGKAQEALAKVEGEPMEMVERGKA
jgi:hypothetical protein